MIVIPSLDLMGGKVVDQGAGPDSSPTVLAEDPLAHARKLRQLGAVFFHVTDLDALFGRGDNLAVMERLASDLIPFQLAGGIRTAEQAARVFAAGADRIVIGTMFLEEPTKAAALVEKHGMRIIAALDVRDGHVVVQGRTNESGHLLAGAAASLVATGVKNVILTPIGKSARDDLPELPIVVEAFEAAIYLRIPVRDEMDIARLESMTRDGLTGVIMANDMHHDALDPGELFART